MLKFLLTLAVLYLALLAAMYVLQRKLMYHPDRAIRPVAEYGLSGFLEERTQADGVALQLWYRPAAEGFPTVAYFHGNAGHLGYREQIYAALAEKGFGVLALSYRGYGLSSGLPSEQGLYEDARAALRFLTENKHIPASRIILYGESLGTGVAVQMALEHPVSMLALQAPYRSVAARAQEIYPFIPVRLLLKDTFDSIDKIGRVKVPVLIFHGELDATIPAAHGRDMLAKAPEPKRGFFLPGVGHNDFDTGMISAHLLDFAKEHKLVF